MQTLCFGPDQEGPGLLFPIVVLKLNANPSMLLCAQQQRNVQVKMSINTYFTMLTLAY